MPAIKARGLVGSKPTLRGSSGKKERTLKRIRINSKRRRMPSVLVLQIPSSCPAVQFSSVVMITTTTAMASVIVLC